MCLRLRCGSEPREGTNGIHARASFIRITQRKTLLTHLIDSMAGGKVHDRTQGWVRTTKTRRHPTRGVPRAGASNRVPQGYIRFRRTLYMHILLTTTLIAHWTHGFDLHKEARSPSHSMSEKYQHINGDGLRHSRVTRSLTMPTVAPSFGIHTSIGGLEKSERP